MATKMQLQPQLLYDSSISDMDNKNYIAKDQLKIGSILHYYGKDAPNTLWIVSDIFYIHYMTKRRYSHKNVHLMSDRVSLICCNEFHKNKYLLFRHISKSPLWRL